MSAAVSVPGEDTLEDARRTVHETVAAWRQRIVDVSRAIHSDPELAFQEHRAAALLAQNLREAGFETTVGVYGLETAVEAVAGDGDLTVTVCAEYDALPGIGHACGHNIIAAAGLGAAIALREVSAALGIRVKLLGTPAEEHGSGKALMLAAGAWEDSTLSLMVHGAPGVDLSCADVRSLAVDRFDVSFHGVATHASAAADGVNAANAATIALVAIGLLRQHLPDGLRLNAFIAEAGEATNIIPANAVVRVEVRSDDLRTLKAVKRRVLSCFEAGAVATGCTWSWVDAEPLYANVIQEPLLAEAWDRSLASLGRHVMPWKGGPGGSTDMGNVSQVVPSIHPMIAVLGSTAMPHTAAFEIDAGSTAAEQAAIDGALAMALTVVDVAGDSRSRADLLERQAMRSAGFTTRAAGEIDEQ